jgi:hypothetical protein
MVDRQSGQQRRIGLVPCVKQAWVEPNELRPPLGDLSKETGIRDKGDAFASFDPAGVVSLGSERRQM